MPAGSTYEPIATTTLGSAQTSVTFSSIPSTYTDLILVYNGENISGQNKYIQFNNDSGANYSCTGLGGDGSAAYSYRFSQSYIDTFSSGTSRTEIIVQISNYSNTTTFKNYISRNSVAAVGVEAIVGLWRSTAAINSLKILLTNSNSFASGSTFTLYGIAAA